MAYKKYKPYRKFKKTFRRYKRPNTSEQGKSMTLTITRSIPLNAMYYRPIYFPLLLPSLVACGTGQLENVTSF